MGVKIRPFRYGKSCRFSALLLYGVQLVKIRPFRYGKCVFIWNDRNGANGLKSDRFGMESSSTVNASYTNITKLKSDRFGMEIHFK